MSRRLDAEYVREVIESTDQYFWIGGEYKNNQSPLVFQDRSGYKYSYGFSHIQHHISGGGTGFEAFNIANIFVLDNIQVWLSSNKPEIEYVSGTYTGAYDTNLEFYCYRCQNRFYSCWNYISDQRRYGCGICGKKVLVPENSLEYLYPELTKEWDYERNDSVPSEIFPGTHDFAWWICHNCDHRWDAEIKSRTLGNGCPNCDSSKGEKRIEKFLIENDVCYIYEYNKFTDCRYKRQLSFDFYLPDYGLCIEYDGSIHFEDKFDNPKEFKEVQIRDKVKTTYCNDHNISLLRIPYWDFNNIEQILTDYLFN
jgi:very-short-patch-repair endonuclease